MLILFIVTISISIFVNIMTYDYPMLLNQLLQILINLVPKLNRPCPALRPCQRHMLGQTLSDHPRRFKKYQGLVNWNDNI